MDIDYSQVSPEDLALLEEQGKVVAEEQAKQEVQRQAQTASDPSGAADFGLQLGDGVLDIVPHYINTNNNAGDESPAVDISDVSSVDSEGAEVAGEVTGDVVASVANDALNPAEFFEGAAKFFGDVGANVISGIGKTGEVIGDAAEGTGRVVGSIFEALGDFSL